MKTLVIFYSYAGHTKKLAERIAAEQSAELLEVLDARRPGIIRAFFSGCPKAMKGDGWPIKDFDTDIAAAERVILVFPTWASSLPPAANELISRLPSGKAVEVIMNSGGGESKCRERVQNMLAAVGCTLAKFEDVKA